MLQTLRYTLRTLLRTPSFTIAALICLALGIGATSAIFSIVNAVVLRPLPYPDSKRLVRIYTEFPTFPGGGLHKFWVSEPEVFDLKTSAKSFESIGAWATTGANVAGLSQPVRVTTTFVSAELLPLLEIKPLMGHFIAPEQDVPGAAPVIVLSYGLWKRAFGGDPKIIGRNTYLNSAKATVIAVMPKGFVFPPDAVDQTEAWSALQLNPKSTNRGGHNYNVLGRLRSGITLTQARDEMARLVARWGEAESPNTHVFSPKQHPVSMYPFYDEVVGGVRRAMLMLLGAVVFVLLIACVNVANLLLARSEARQREIAVRRAMGASTGDLMKQFIFEGAFLSVVGAALGIALASQSLKLIESTNSGSIPRIDEIRLDWRVLLFTLGVSVITGILFGLAPFIHVSAIRVYETLKAAGGRASSTVASNRYRQVLVVAQMAMAFLLVAGAGLMVRGFWKLQQVNPGFNPSSMLTFNVALPQATYKDANAARYFWRVAQERIGRLPGVSSVTMLYGLPPLRPENDNDTDIENFVRVPGGPIQNVAFYQIAGDKVFQTLGARLIEGRFLEPQDGTETTPGIVINASMARTFWPHQSALGRRVRFAGPKAPWIPIVGVIADIKNSGLDKPAGTELFIPYQLLPDRDGLDSPNIVVKTSGNPLAITSEVRRVIASIDPSLPLAKIRTIDDVVAAASSRPRFLTLILTMFSVLALGLAAVGIYGVISYSVEQRTTEFGIKMALGAEPQQLLLQVIGQGLFMGIIGVGVGILGALLLTRSLEGLFFGVSQLDPPSFILTAVILTIATLAACLLPALRAMRIEPVTALRYE
ncbi:MAG: ABC transporter permease [Acidobacteriaceae bacterium]|nr:ABC transporter permease [Acidobacteriaceae bacterium]MBV9780799.1 ABC transporter permease [Acidobacteriaceae bacterium]